ncbi:MAG: hypothetical protein P4L91_07045, partial [Burkholderiaceae bacterium]|nr:hypothetical protein [Burkholderiaceae bacterium]
MHSNNSLNRRSARAAAAFCAAMAIGASAFAVEYTTEDYKRAVATCMRVNDFECAAKNWRQ